MFNVYVNDLVNVMEASRNGCMIQGEFVVFVLYAGDIQLVSGSRLKLQKLLDICDLYAKDLTFWFLIETNLSAWYMLTILIILV